MHWLNRRIDLPKCDHCGSINCGPVRCNLNGKWQASYASFLRSATGGVRQPERRTDGQG